MAIFYMDYVNGNDNNDGSSWALAKKTITGFTSLNPGDTVRIAKSPDPVSLGNATWTDGSATVTLTSALTLNIETCETAWTPSANVTAGVTTTNKEGTNAITLTIADAFETGIIAYKSITTLDCSAYQQISFWIKASVAVAPNTLRVDLCSDSSGSQPVDSFTIDIKLEADCWYPLSYNKGSSLGNNINSISLYALLDPGAVTITMDNIFAHNGLSLQSLIGKDADDGCWWALKSINGTTLILGESQQTGTDVTPYAGTTETVTTYRRETIKTTLATSPSTSVQTVQNSGIEGNEITFSGGWNTTTNVQDGLTFFDGLMEWGYGITGDTKSYVKLEKIAVVRYNYGFYFYRPSVFTYADSCMAISNKEGGFVQLPVINCFANQNRFGLYDVFYQNYMESRDCKLLSNITGGIYNNFSISICSPLKNFFMRRNGADFYRYNLGIVGLDIAFTNSLFGSTTEINLAYSARGIRVTSHHHDQIAGNHKQWIVNNYEYTNYFDMIEIETNIFHTAPPSVKLTPVSSIYKHEWLRFLIPCESGVLKTIKAWMRWHTDGTDTPPMPRLRLRGCGITETTQAMTAAEDTWEEVTISGTPTEDGVLELIVECWKGTSTTYVYVDDVSFDGNVDARGMKYWYRANPASFPFNQSATGGGETIKGNPTSLLGGYLNH